MGEEAAYTRKTLNNKISNLLFCNISLRSLLIDNFSVDASFSLSKCSRNANTNVSSMLMAEDAKITCVLNLSIK